MAEQTPFYMDINNVYSGDELGLPYRDLVSEGVVASTDLAVTAGTGNTVNVAAGAGWVTGDTDVNRQPTYRIYNDAVVNKGITPDPTNPRYVLVVAQINDATFSGALRNWTITAIHGTPAGSPVVPALPASALRLAQILVPAAAASSAAYTITDVRIRAVVGNGTVLKAPTVKITAAPFSCPNSVPSKVPFSPGGTLFWDTGNFWDVTQPTRLTCQRAGIYWVKAQGDWAASAAGYREIYILKTGTTVSYYQILPTIATGNAPHIFTTSLCQMGVGDYFELQVNQSSGGALTFNQNSGYEGLEVFQVA